MKINDCHNDFLTEIKQESQKLEYIRYLKHDIKLKNICCVVWTTKLKNPIEFLNKVKLKFLNKNKKLILCIEDLGFINENNYILILKKIVELKPFACGLVWNYDNNLGGGAFGKKSLTKLGEKIITILESQNILIDTAHMNRKTFWKFCKITTKPIYNSHCNINYFKPHKRNLNDKQIKYIINSKGFIGFSFVDYFMSNNLVDTKIIAKQIAYFVKKYKIDCLGIGSDFYGTKNLPINLKNYNDFKNLKISLKNEGLTKKEINKIFNKNFETFKNNLN